MSAPTPKRNKSTAATSILVAAVFTVSVSGFFMGLRQTVSESSSGIVLAAESIHEEDTQTDAILAPSYSEIATAGYSSNSSWKSRLSDLAPNDAFESILTTDSAELRYRRDSRRAYDGAPPVVPHPIDQHSAESCLQCHGEALRIGDVVASGISHPQYTSCTQCHVSAKGLGSQWNTSDFDLHTGNRFGGFHQPLEGDRAYPDSPPTIPHNVHMRQNCISCHGPMGTSPIRTSHPDRQSCNQCHVPGEEIDKTNFSESPFPFWERLSTGEPAE